MHSQQQLLPVGEWDSRSMNSEDEEWDGRAGAPGRLIHAVSDEQVSSITRDSAMCL